MRHEIIQLSEWYRYDPKEIMSFIYWLRGQLPPADDEKYEESWKVIKADLTDKFGVEE